MYNINGLYTISVNGVLQFQAANPAAGIANGTQVTADWLNDVQGELLNFVTKALLAPQPNTPTQVLEAAAILLTSTPQYVTLGSNPITSPPWANRVRYRLWGGGASGGVAASTSTRAGGGGAGGYAEGEAPITPGVMQFTIGAGGAGSNSGNGNAGGTTTLGSIASATGGTAGSGVTPYAGGISGVGTILEGAGIGYGLGDGSDGDVSANEPGGGGGGAGGRGANNSNGLPGRGPGGGGGGCTQGFTSGAGANGLIILQWLP